jgi:hypothetical protein
VVGEGSDCRLQIAEALLLELVAGSPRMQNADCRM